MTKTVFTETVPVGQLKFMQCIFATVIKPACLRQSSNQCWTYHTQMKYCKTSCTFKTTQIWEWKK